MAELQQDHLKKINREQTIALIPARGGSKGVPGKNIQTVEGYPLIAYSIAAGKLSKHISRVIVSTDSEEIAEIAGRYGAEVPFLRPAEYATDAAGYIGFVEHAIGYLCETEKNVAEYLVHLRPTTPLREAGMIDRAIEACMAHGECSSLRSAHKAPESPFKWFLKDDRGYYKSIREGMDNDTANTGRENFPDVYIPDGYVDVLRSSYVITRGRLHGENMIAFESPACTEIDTPEDLAYLRYEIRKKGSALLRYLRENYQEEE